MATVVVCDVCEGHLSARADEVLSDSSPWMHVRLGVGYTVIVGTSYVVDICSATCMRDWLAQIVGSDDIEELPVGEREPKLEEADD